MLSIGDIRRLDLGYFTAPADHRLPGQKIAVCGYLIDHPGGLVLFDSGLGEGPPEIETFYRPVRHSLARALRNLGIETGEVRFVVNCHLHFDHCGENKLFPDTPILAQAKEYEAARASDYTLPALVDFPRATFELLDGEADVLPGVRIVPTPGHVPGHQSLVVEAAEGRVVIAGQAFDSASEYAVAQYAWRLEATGAERQVSYPDWIRRIQEFDPWRVLFAHDFAIWEAERIPGTSSDRRTE